LPIIIVLLGGDWWLYKEDLDFFKEMRFEVRKVSIDYNGAKGLSV